MERYFETLFRFKWLFLFVLVLVPSLGAGYAIDQRQVLYQSVGTVWADKPAYLDIASQDWNQWNTPAQNQASNVQEFLQTNSFALEVLNQTDLRANLTTQRQAQQTLTNLRTRVSITAAGTHLLAISYSDEQPKVAQQVVQAIIDTFDKEVLSSATSQNSVALAFYQKKLQDVTATAANSTAALRTYLEAHPELTQGTNATQAQVSQLVANASFAAQHPELVKLIQDQQTATDQQSKYQAQVDQIQFSQSSEAVGTGQSFRIMDPPAFPTSALSSKKKLVLEIGIAVGAAVGFVVGGVVLLTALDTTLRSATVAADRLELPVLVMVPLLNERRGLIRRQRFSHRHVRTLLAMEAHLPELTGPTVRA
jgi:uncharacterized protein involved in exopolysaccharide biosynthesis